MFVLEFDIIESMLLEEGDVGIFGCTIIYHAIK